MVLLGSTARANCAAVHAKRPKQRKIDTAHRSAAHHPGHGHATRDPGLKAHAPVALGNGLARGAARAAPALGLLQRHHPARHGCSRMWVLCGREMQKVWQAGGAEDTGSIEQAGARRRRQLRRGGAGIGDRTAMHGTACTDGRAPAAAGWAPLRRSPLRPASGRPCAAVQCNAHLLTS